MKLTVFQSEKGDCLLVTGADGRTILADGGMAASYREHAAETLSKLGQIDLVYVSHIDQDHISGVLQMLDDLVAWRVYDYHQNGGGNGTVKEPAFPRPPEIGRIWHNAFHEQITKNTGPIADMFAAFQTTLEQTEPRGGAEAMMDLATSVAEAIRLSRRIGAPQLGIPLNPEFDGKLMFLVEDPPNIRVGGMRVQVIGPFAEDLKNLRKDWVAWLKANQAALAKIRARAKRDEDGLGNDVSVLLEPLLAQAKVLGDRAAVTPPNLASLMLLVEEGNTSLLLTGDGHQDDILAGLDQIGALDQNGRKHVSCLKVQHHGSENNIDEAFCEAITADHYVFCGNGAHTNPELDVVELIIDSRLAGAGPNRRFTLWFNSNSSAPKKANDRAQMRKLEALVKARAQASDRLRYHFMPKGESKLAIKL